MAPGVPVNGAWCVESASLVAPLTHRAPVTHHGTVVRTCHWCAETKFPAGINLVQTVSPNWRRIESLMALDLIKIPAVSALSKGGMGAHFISFLAPSQLLVTLPVQFLHF